MNFTIILEIILTYILCENSDIVHCNIKNMDLENVYNTYLSSSILNNNNCEDIYCKCEFQNPSLILGKSFNQKYMMKLCEMNILGHADIAKQIQFTLIGSHVCDAVCKKCGMNIKQQNKNMNLKIVLMKNYCDMIDKENEHITNLANHCICVFRVQSYKWQTVIVYKFHANPQGLIKVQSS